MRDLLLAFAALSAAACLFDARGRPNESAGAAAADAAEEDASVDSAPAPAPDAYVSEVDAAPANCCDWDGDGYWIAQREGFDCGPPDCDDTDERVFPGQTVPSALPTQSGGFDFNCDGQETPYLDTEVSGDCRMNWFECRGTGWVEEVPDCGNEARWHQCVETGILQCGEESSQRRQMPCL